MDEQLQRLSPEAIQKAIDSMTLEQKAELGYLPDYLSIAEICDLIHPVKRQIPKDQTERASWRLKKHIKAAYQDDLINACKAGKLAYQPGKVPNIFIPDLGPQIASKEWLSEFSSTRTTRPDESSINRFAIIHKAEFKRYCESLEQWPVNGLLAYWWINEQSNTATQTNINSTPTPPKTYENERELTTWLRETWIKEGMPDGTAFFNSLKKYVNQKGSPIMEHWTTGKTGAGFRWNTGSTTANRTKKRIQNMVSVFKNEYQKNTVNQK